MSRRTSFVTGGYGLLGAWLIRALLERGDEVVALRRDRRPRSTLQMLGLEDEVVVVDGDICDTVVVDRTIGEYDVDTVFHLAAQTIVGTAQRSPAPTFEANVAGTWSVLEAVRRHGVPRTVVASSDKAYGPTDDLPYREEHPLRARYPYDASKAAADIIARSYWWSYEVPVAVTRFANLYGGGDTNPSRLVPEVIEAALDGRAPVIRSDGTPERDYLYVEDAAAAYLAIADALDDDGVGREGVAGEAFNAGSGRSWSVAEVVGTICRLAGSDLEPEILGSGVPDGEIDVQFVDPTRIRERCGWVPSVDLEEGLSRTIAWYRDHPEHWGR